MVNLKSKQHLDQQFIELKDTVLGNLNESFSLEDGFLRCQGRLCVLNIDG